jgi:imidazoleglycerol phosphate synthase glutamine amidotransferase subunit HisH
MMPHDNKLRSHFHKKKLTSHISEVFLPHFGWNIVILKEKRQIVSANSLFYSVIYITEQKSENIKK